MKSIDLSTYTTPLTRRTLPSEIMEYRHARTGPLAEVKNLRAMGEIIADATMELWATTDAGRIRIDALEAQVWGFEGMTITSPVKESKGAK